MAPQAPSPRPGIAALAGYAWEESSESIAARLGIDVARVVRFDMNTVPWQLPVPVSVDAVALNEYPDSTYAELVSAVAAYCDWPASGIVVGAGADELLSLVAQAYLDGTRRYAVSDPSYSMFRVVSDIAGATALSVPCDDSFAVDRPRLFAAAADAHVTWIANPNNPTGEVLPQDVVRDLAAAARGLVVVDEAYAEFVDSSSLSWAAEAPNVVVVRTLSKAFGLAGMRAGYALAAPAVVSVLHRVRPPGSITALSSRMGVAALRHAPLMREHVRALLLERRRLAAALGTTGRRVIEGGANFLLVELEDGAVAAALAQGLVVRSFDHGHRLHGWSRVTVRSREENDRLLQALPPRH